MPSQEFRVPRRFPRERLIEIGSSLFFFVVIAGALWLRPELRKPYGYPIGAAAALFLAWSLLRGRQERAHRNWPVVIDEEGIRCASPAQIGWAEVSGLEVADERVDLCDAQGRARISLSYDLEDADEVIQFVADVLTDRWPQSPLPHEFRHNPPRMLLALAAALIAALGAALFLTRGDRPVQQLFAAAMALVLGALVARWARMVRRLTVGKQDLTAVKGSRSRVFNYADIEALGLAVAGPRTERHLDVKVTLRDKRVRYVLPWRGDPFDVYATIKAAWESGRASASGGPASSSKAG